MQWIRWALLAMSVSAALAQTFTATVRGVVNDASGAVVSGAVITLTHVDQNRSVKYTTNQNGEYEFLQVPPGNYTLTAEATGFKKYQRSGMVLEVAQVAAIDVLFDDAAATE